MKSIVIPVFDYLTVNTVLFNHWRDLCTPIVIRHASFVLLKMQWRCSWAKNRNGRGFKEEEKIYVQ